MENRPKQKRTSLYWLLMALASGAGTLSLCAFPNAMFSAQGNTVRSFVLWFALGFLLHRALGAWQRRRGIVSLLGGGILGGCQAVGDVLQADGGLPSAVISFFGYALLYACLLCLLFAWLDRRETAQKISSTAAPQRPLPGLVSRLLAPGRRSFLWCWLLVLLCWLVWLVAFFPGLMSVDAWVQMLMVFGGRDFSTHHPVLHTLYITGFMQLGQALLGNMAAGFAAATILQWLALAALVSYTLQCLAKSGVSLWFRLGVLLFYALYPYMGMYSITLLKDPWLSAFTLLFVINIAAISRDYIAFFAQKSRVAGMLLATLGMLFAKNTGLYIFVITLLVMLLALKTCRKQLLAWLLTCLVIYGLVDGLVFPAAGIQKGDLREMLPTPITQVAAVVTYAEDSLSQEDKALIAAVLPYENIQRDYNTQIADFIKDQFDTETFLQNPGAYLSLYVRLGLKHPGLYLKAFLAQSYGFWYPDVMYWNFHLLPYTSFVRIYDVDFGGREVPGQYNEPFFGAVAAVNAAGTAVSQMPLLSILLSVGIWFWLLLVLSLCALYQKRYRQLLPLLPLWVVWLTCLVSPMYSEIRYMLPLVYALPFCAGQIWGGAPVAMPADPTHQTGLPTRQDTTT